MGGEYVEGSLSKSLAKPVEVGRRFIDTMQEYADSLAPLDLSDRTFMLDELRRAIENEPKNAKLFRELQIAWLQRGIKDINNKVTEAKRRSKRPEPEP